MQLGGRGARRVLFLVIAAAFALRLSVWPRVFSDGRVYLDGPDGYYHLRRAAMTLEQWPLVPQFDPMLNYPTGGLISWPPLFDWLLATLALPWRTDAALERIGAFLPPIMAALQLVVLYLLVRSLRNRRAALAAVFVAAILPAAVRYTLLGNLDHDPFYTLCILIALLGVSVESAVLVAIGLACGILGWTGAVVGVAIVTFVALARRVGAGPPAGTRPAEGPVATLAFGATAAAVVILPFVATSVWRVATFEGLSWLHITVLVGAGAIGAILSRKWPLAIVNGVALLALLPISIGPLISGTKYAAGDAPILSMVAEAQPLLALFGTFDIRPLLIRFGLLPLLAVILLPLLWKRERSRDVLFITPWVVVTLVLALLHSRFSFDAAIALAAFAGIAFDAFRPDGLNPVLRRAAIALALLPILPAYVPISSLEPFNFYLRPNVLRDYEMDRICEWLRGRPPGAVLAPWSFGHWIVWIARKPVVISPMLSVGQSEFAEGLRFFFLEDLNAAQEFLAKHGVRYFIVTPEIDSIVPRARVAGIDPARYPDPRAYARTIAARLTFGGPFNGFREVMRSRVTIGPVPLVRVYEVSRPRPRG
jgi:dolichyl-diphosphooligosaccharide--protein glycosyltransferase